MAYKAVMTSCLRISISNVNSSLFCEYILEIDEQEEAGEIGEVSNSAPMFAAEEELLFSRRFENRYDLPDPKYIRWLRIHHPIATSVLSETSTADLLEGPSVTTVSVNPQSSPVVRNSTPHHSVAQPPTEPALRDQSDSSGAPSSTGQVSMPKCLSLAELVNTPKD